MNAAPTRIFGLRAAILNGGCWAEAAGAGVACLNFKQPASIAGPNIGVRLARRAMKPQPHGDADSAQFGDRGPRPASARAEEKPVGAASSPSG